MEVLLAKEVRNRSDLERTMRRDHLIDASLQTVDKANELLSNTSVLSDIPIMGMTNTMFEASFHGRSRVTSKGLQESPQKKSEKSRIEEVTERIKQKILERGWDLGGL